MTTPVFFPRPSTLALAAALLVGAAAPALAHGPKPHAEGGIASAPSKAVKAPFDIVHTRITTEGRTTAWPNVNGQLQTGELTVFDYPGLLRTTQPAFPAVPSG